MKVLTVHRNVGTDWGSATIWGTTAPKPLSGVIPATRSVKLANKETYFCISNKSSLDIPPKS